MATLDLPRAVKVDDYHEFRALEKTLRSLGVKGVKVQEVGFDGAQSYVGIVYVGTKPNSDEVVEATFGKKYLKGIKDFEEGNF